jgi:hypothetical protein
MLNMTIDKFSDVILVPFPFTDRTTIKKRPAVDCAFYTYTLLLRLMTLIFLAQFLRSDRQNPQAAIVVQNLKTPTLENWHTALRTLTKQLFPPLPGKSKEYRFSSFTEGSPPRLPASRGRNRLKNPMVWMMPLPTGWKRDGRPPESLPRKPDRARPHCSAGWPRT